MCSIPIWEARKKYYYFRRKREKKICRVMDGDAKITQTESSTFTPINFDLLTFRLFFDSRATLMFGYRAVTLVCLLGGSCVGVVVAGGIQ